MIIIRLWHQDIIGALPRNQLLGQHRELCALRGLGFNKKHKTINYVFYHPYSDLFHFHLIVIKEMKKRGYFVNPLWEDIHYRGKKLGMDYSIFTLEYPSLNLIYTEHDLFYLISCLKNLEKKNIFISYSSVFLFKYTLEHF